MNKRVSIICILATAVLYSACNESSVSHTSETGYICGNETCTENQYCDKTVWKCKNNVEPDSGDLCDLIHCDAGKTCRVVNNILGCYDDECLEDGVIVCSAGQMCVKGECVDDGCKNKMCKKGESCLKGVCIEDACRSIHCDDDKTCRAGECVENLCLDVVCDSPFSQCIGGKCLVSCQNIVCEDGSVCVDGQCIVNSDPAIDPELVVTIENDGKTTDENGKKARISVVLNKMPKSEVKITAQVSDNTEAKVVCGDNDCSLVFNASNWNVPQFISLQGIGDNMIDGDQSYALTLKSQSSDDFNGLSKTVEGFTNEDVDVASIMVSVPEGAMTTEKGGTVEIGVVLSSQPSDEVTFDVSSSKKNKALVEPGTVTFKPENWNIKQSLTVTGVDDKVVNTLEENTYQIVFTNTESKDAHYNDLKIEPIELINQDDDSSGVTVSTKQVTVEEGSETSFTVVLNSQPTKNVTIIIENSNNEEVDLDASELTFTKENWKDAQKVIISGVQDNVIDGNQPFNITLKIKSNDEKYAKLDNIIISGKCIDKTSAGVNITVDSLNVSENGTKANIQMVLTVKPELPVEIQSFISDETEIKFANNDMKTLIFNADNWNKPQTVTIQGVDDEVIDGNISSEVSFMTSSKESYFDMIKINPLTFVTEDNDYAEIIVTGDSVSLKEEGNETATFDVSLSAVPNFDVEITMNSSDASELEIVGDKKITFNRHNGTKPVKVQVVSKDDLECDGNKEAYIQLKTNTNDAHFSGLTAQSPKYIVVDNETADLIVTSEGMTLKENKHNGVIHVSLNSAPAKDVTVKFDSERSDIAKIGTILTFTKDNWNVVQDENVEFVGFAAAKSEFQIHVRSTSDMSSYNNIEKNVAVTAIAWDKEVYGYTGSSKKISLYPGTYLFEAWGASGGGTIEGGQFGDNTKGLGGYASGKLTLDKKTDFYIFVGGQGQNAQSGAMANGGWNGGGQGSYYKKTLFNKVISDNASGGGGGATDFRLVDGAWDAFDSLKSRIMVAGAGGGQCSNVRYTNGKEIDAGYGGGLQGNSGTSHYSAGTQTSGYQFGKGMNGDKATLYLSGIGGGGGGYYGGSTSDHKKTGVDYINTCSGAGGSGFVSGHTGCNAISQSSTEGNIQHTGSNVHYSNIKFFETQLISGNLTMPTTYGGTEVGHRGNGAVKITRID